jgi:hypothetical protein
VAAADADANNAIAGKIFTSDSLIEPKEDWIDRFIRIAAHQMLEALHSAARGGADPCHWSA